MRQEYQSVRETRETRTVYVPPKKSAKKPLERMTLDELATEITKRGNVMELKVSKDGIKVFEVTRKLVKTISVD